MKKFTGLFLVLCIIVGLSACSEKSPNETQTPSEEYANTQSTTPEEIHWEKAYYVDEFGDQSNEWYLRGIFKGSFSNTATSGSPLTAILYCDQFLNAATYDSFSIRLLEYDSHIANISHYDEYDVTIKIKIDGKVYEGKPYYFNGDDIVIKRGDDIFKETLEALNAGKTVSFYIQTLSRSGNITATYRFSVDTTGLNEIPHTWIGKL